MDRDFWIKKWEEKDIRFHQAQYHPMLVKYGKDLPEGNVLVPLCGKTLDMIYLTSIGRKVIGVELSDIACREFFSENKIPFTEKIAPGFIRFESEKITLYCGDFFQLPVDVWKSINGIYDRAAIVALPAELRIRYANEIITRTPKGSSVLLISFDYPEARLQGPPFSVPDDELKKLFRGCEIELIDSRKDSIRENDVFENTYRIRIL